METSKAIDLTHPVFDFKPQHDLTQILANLVTGPDHQVNQYAPDFGNPRLIKVLTKIYSGLLNLDCPKSFLVTDGTKEAIFVGISGYVEKGDEVIVVRPGNGCIPIIRSCGAKEIILNWPIDRLVLQSLFNSKTKMIVLSNPNFMIGEALTLTDLEAIAECCRKWNVLCLVDESLEWTLFETSKHIRMATLPGMWYRTLTIGSAGTSVKLTGWPIGWIYGSPELINNTKVVHSNLTGGSNNPLQEALAIAFENDFKKYVNNDIVSKNLKVLIKAFSECGLKPFMPDGGYYLPVDVSSKYKAKDFVSEDDAKENLRTWLIKELGVNGKLYNPNIVIFSFVNNENTIQLAVKKLNEFKHRR